MTTQHREWPPRLVPQLSQDLKRLAGDLEDAQRSDSDAVVHLSKLLVIRSVGFLEQVAVETVRGYLTGKTSGPPLSFSTSWLRGRNPTPDKLEELVSRFGETFSAKFADLLDQDDQLVRRELSFLVDQRNKIAHGLIRGISTRKALDLMSVAERTSDWFISNMNPTRH